MQNWYRYIDFIKLRKFNSLHIRMQIDPMITIYYGNHRVYLFLLYLKLPFSYKEYP